MEKTKRDKTKEQGLTFIIVGTLLLFYMLGILTRGIVVIIAALYMIIKGFMMTGYHKKIMQLFESKKRTIDKEIQ